MPPPHRRTLTLIAVGLLLAGTALWLAQARRHALREIAALHARGSTDQQEIARLKAELARARQRESEMNAAPPIPTPPPVSPDRAAAEDELDAWFGRVSALRDFLTAHPEYAIPELKHASLLDWLDVTKSGTFRTEADFRKSAFELRNAVKQETMKTLREAMTAFKKTYPGAALTDVTQLTASLPADFDPTILHRYQVDAKIPDGWPKNMGDKPPTAVILEAVVAPLWDQQSLIGDNGLTMIRGVGQDVRVAVQKSIATYTSEHGSAPTDFAAVSPLIDSKIDPALAAEMFQALTPP